MEWHCYVNGLPMVGESLDCDCCSRKLVVKHKLRSPLRIWRALGRFVVVEFDVAGEKSLVSHSKEMNDRMILRLLIDASRYS